MLKQQRFGVEIELTGISRGKAAEVIAEYFNSSLTITGDSYNTRTIKDTQGREWKVMRDSSIRPQPVGNEFKVEVVSPTSTLGVKPSTSSLNLLFFLACLYAR
jgi:hypothetical protein